MNPEALYRNLASLASAIPDFGNDFDSDETKRWLGRLHALVAETGNLVDVVSLDTKIGHLGVGRFHGPAVDQIKTVLFRALTKAELSAPASVQGAFIAAGSAFDAFAAVGRVLAEATRDVLLIDPYMDASILTDFAPMAPEGVQLRLLADEACAKETLAPAAARWQTQYGGARPLSVRLAPGKSLHDRSIIVDGARAWISTQSFKDLAARSPATFTRLEGDAVPLKIEAYDQIWNQSRDLLP